MHLPWRTGDADSRDQLAGGPPTDSPTELDECAPRFALQWTKTSSLAAAARLLHPPVNSGVRRATDIASAPDLSLLRVGAAAPAGGSNAARAGYRRRRGSWVAASHKPSRPPATRPTSGQGWCPGCSAVISTPTKEPITARLSTSTILMPAHLPACDAGWPGSLPAPGTARGRLLTAVQPGRHGLTPGVDLSTSRTWSPSTRSGGAGRPGPAMARCQDRPGASPARGAGTSGRQGRPSAGAERIRGWNSVLDRDGDRGGGEWGQGGG